MPLVFIVDDEKLIADTLLAILRATGLAAEAFYDPQTALERARDLTPDLLLSDIIMPGMDGYSLAELIKQRHPGCRVLLFSGNANATQYRCLLGETSQLVNVEVLSKPIAPATLIARIQQLLSFGS